MENQNSANNNAEQKKVVVTCESNVDISVAGDFHALLQQALTEHSAVEIDASNVERVDAAVLQVLHSFMKEADKEKLEVNWKGISTAFSSSANLLGMSETLRFP
jgi:anti-anti-sigma regulatory factor